MSLRCAASARPTCRCPGRRGRAANPSADRAPDTDPDRDPDANRDPDPDPSEADLPEEVIPTR